MPRPAPPGYRELNVGEPLPSRHWWYTDDGQLLEVVARGSMVGVSDIGKPYRPAGEHCNGRYVKLSDFETAISDQMKLIVAGFGKSWTEYVAKYELTEAEMAWLLDYRGGCQCPNVNPPCGACSSPVTEAEWEMIEEQRREKKIPKSMRARCQSNQGRVVPEGYRELQDGEVIEDGDMQFATVDPAIPRLKTRKSTVGDKYNVKRHHCGAFRKIEKEKPVTDPPAQQTYTDCYNNRYPVPKGYRELRDEEPIPANAEYKNSAGRMISIGFGDTEVGSLYTQPGVDPNGFDNLFVKLPESALTTPWYQQASGPEAAAHEGEWWVLHCPRYKKVDGGPDYLARFTAGVGWVCVTGAPVNRPDFVASVRHITAEDLDGLNWDPKMKALFDKEFKGAFATQKPKITEEKENTMQQTCRCREAVDGPVPEGYRELEDGELIQEGDVKFDDPVEENYDLVEANGVGKNYQPHGNHSCGRFRKISQFNTQSINQGEIMSSNKLFETKHYVDGTEISNLSAEQIYSIITRREAQIKNLQEAKHQPARLKKYIAGLEKELTDLVNFLDERDAKEEKPAPVTE